MILYTNKHVTGKDNDGK